MGYIVVPSEKRFLVLLTFLKKNRDKKLAVLFSSCKAVDHFSELLNDLDPSLSISILHENLNQACRTQTLAQFDGSKKSILLCTDIILQNTVLPPLDWIVQYDQPTDPQKYVRLAASLSSKTTVIENELLFLREEELGFLMYLREAKIPLNEYDMKYNRVANIQSQIEKRISENYALHISAQDAYKHFIRSYASHPQKSVFDVNKLDLVKVALSFGFKVPPFVDLSNLNTVNNVHDKVKTLKRKRENDGVAVEPKKARKKNKSSSGKRIV